MSRARSGKIVLPDALSSRRRPGPSVRSLEAHRELSSALRAKELISQWRTPLLQSDGIADLQLREALTRTLAPHGTFGYIREGSKLPHSHPKRSGSPRVIETESGLSDFLRANGTDWLGASTAPASGNWSVIPQRGSRLFIFDLDVSKLQISEDGTELPTSVEDRYLEARRSIGYLSSLLGVDLRSTYAQLSPSGGVHIFVLLPEGTDPSELPSAKISDGMRALAGIPQELWHRELRGDLRSGASNGFILMAGSRLSVEGQESSADDYYRPLVSDPRWSDFKDYRSARKLRLLELPSSAVERLRAARAMDLELRAQANPPAATETVEQLAPLLPALSQGRVARELNPGSYSRLLRRLKEQPPESFHRARAQIYRALSCCGSLESIAELCRDAGYGRDSYSNRELSLEELLADMESMERRGMRAERCGSHCGSLRVVSEAPDGHRLELKALAEEIHAAKLSESVELSALGHRRAAESSILEARIELSRRAQRGSDFGIYGKRRPRGLNYRELIREILGERSFTARLSGQDRAIAGYRLRALELVLGYFAPLFAAGAPVAIAPVSELTELFGWTPSQLREALRFLRSSGVLSLERRQVSGRASAYGPGEQRFLDGALSKRLRQTWGASMALSATGERAFLGGFFDHQRGRIVRPDGSSYTDSYLREIGGGYTGLLLELAIELPRARSIASSVVTRYLGKALSRYLSVSSDASRAQDTLDELQQLRPSASERELLPTSFIAVEDLWMSGRTFREHSSEGSSSRRRSFRSSPGFQSDRSPPDDPG